jgi:hypothetical protein
MAADPANARPASAHIIVRRPATLPRSLNMFAITPFSKCNFTAPLLAEFGNKQEAKAHCRQKYFPVHRHIFGLIYEYV